MGWFEELCVKASKERRNTLITREFVFAALTAVFWFSGLVVVVKDIPLAIVQSVCVLLSWTAYRHGQHLIRTNVLRAYLEVLQTNPRRLSADFWEVHTDTEKTSFDPSEGIRDARSYMVKLTAPFLPPRFVRLSADEIEKLHAELRDRGATLERRKRVTPTYRDGAVTDYDTLCRQLLEMKLEAEQTHLFLGFVLLGCAGLLFWVDEHLVLSLVSFVIAAAGLALVLSRFNTLRVRRFVAAIADGDEVRRVSIDQISSGRRRRGIALTSELPTGRFEVTLSYGAERSRFTFSGERREVLNVLDSLRLLPAR